MERLAPSLLAPTDLLVVGGGIHGAGIAAEAAQRGLSVVLCEQNDLASGTSSTSTKLIHGGLRYLEHFAFRFVRASLQERARLLSKAPHLIQPIDFIMPCDAERRPLWWIRCGLFLYDHLAPRQRFARSKMITLPVDPLHNPLAHGYHTAFSYADCVTDDARLVIANAQLAQRAGARIYPQVTVTQATPTAEGWTVQVWDNPHQQSHTLYAKAIVNATGPWVSQFQGQILHQTSPYTVRWVKGSHIVTHQLYPGPQAYVLQNFDGRIIFVVPYQGNYTLIGTTEVPYSHDLAQVTIDPAEIKYLCHAVNQYFYRKIHARDVVHHWSGVRPLLYDAGTDPSENTRDYQLDIQESAHHAPALSVFGGKLTTYRQLSVEAVAALHPYFPRMKNPPSPHLPLPGGDIGTDLRSYLDTVRETYPWLPLALAERYLHTYGTALHTLLKGAEGMGDLGRSFGEGLFEREVEYLRRHEWAMSADDILWRRTKLGLRFNAEEREHLMRYLEA